MPVSRVCASITLASGVFLCGMWAQSAQEFYAEGSRLFSAGDSDAAIAAFHKSIELKPDFGIAWKALGVVYASRGDFEAAEPSFRNACERQASLPGACLYYGRTLYLLNRFEPAVNSLRALIQREKEDPEAYRLLALSLEALGQNDQAAAAFIQALRYNRGAAPNEDPGIDYGVFLYRKGRPEEALAPLEAALKRHPDAFRAHLELGCVQLALDKLDDAAAHLERAVMLDPRSTRAALLLGKVRQRR